MKKELLELLVALIESSLKDMGIDKPADLDIALDIPADFAFGDYSSNLALRLGSLKKQKATELAAGITEQIKNKLEKSPVKKYVQEVKAEGAGFINFYLSRGYFYEYLGKIVIQEKEALSTDYGEGKAALVEFVSANPTGPLSVAHARQAAVGDALANILDFAGFKAKREYYLNDEGNQVNILGASIELRLKELSGEKIDFPENHYQGDYIYDLARRIKDQNLKIKDFSEYGIKDILKTIKKELDDFGVKFDTWYSQKVLRESGKIQKALDFLKKQGFLYEQDGALWFKSTQFADDKDRVVVKSDGAYTYLAPDIAYHQDKYQRGFKWLINLWGPDHHGYISRLKAAVRALGYQKDSLSIIIVQLATVFREGKPIEMSTRKGQYITLREVLDEVGRDAARFFFLMRRTSSHLDFDLELAKKQTPENPVYYVQYAYARISSILRQLPAGSKLNEAGLNLLKEKEEIDLIRKLWKFSAIINICLKTADPYMLTVYLQEVAEYFHRFYDRHRVLGENQKLSQSRLALISATRVVLGTALDLLGISRLEKM